MPFTPFHLGPALLVGALLSRRLDVPALLVGSVVVDVRAALVVFGPLDGPVHGVLTTFLGGGVVAVAVAGVTWGVPRPRWSAITPGTGATDSGRPRVRPVVAGALVGVYSHVLLDALLYPDVRPFFPFDGNPFLLGGEVSVPVYVGCAAAGGVGIALLVARATTGPG